MTDPRAAAGAAHLGYEVWQMALAASELERLGHVQQPGVADQKEAIVYNALLESTLLHCRELIDVLLDTNRRGDDIRLADFGSQWRISERDRASLAATKVLLNKHLVHLTWERVDAPPDPWSYQDTIAHLVRLFEDVLNDLRTRLQEGSGDPVVVRTLAWHLGLAQREMSSGWSGRHLAATSPLAVTSSPSTLISVTRHEPPGDPAPRPDGPDTGRQSSG